jgi:hypothetical protein
LLVHQDAIAAVVLVAAGALVAAPPLSSISVMRSFSWVASDDGMVGCPSYLSPVHHAHISQIIFR